MSKFKKGDVIVVVRNTYEIGLIDYVGRRYRIWDIANGACYPRNGTGAHLVDVELASVVDSPLYKALS